MGLSGEQVHLMPARLIIYWVLSKAYWSMLGLISLVNRYYEIRRA